MSNYLINKMFFSWKRYKTWSACSTSCINFLAVRENAKAGAPTFGTLPRDNYTCRAIHFSALRENAIPGGAYFLSF